MIKPLISVVIAVYNIEDYVDLCINSIVNQTYLNLEIIIIDDGSNDRSGLICDRWQRVDSRVRVIHQNNKGLSHARNKGIEYSNGEYITFIDGDDSISVKMIELLFDCTQQYEADIACCGIKNEYQTSMTKEKKRRQKKKNSLVITWDSKEAIRKMLLMDCITNSAWGKLYKKNLFVDVRYPVGVNYEDLATTYKLMMRANKIAYLGDELYQYNYRYNSIQNERFERKCFDEIDMAIDSNCNILTRYPELEIECINRLVSSCFHVLFRWCECNESVDVYTRSRINEVVSIIRQERIKCIISSRVSLKVKMGCICSYLGVNNAYRIYSIARVRGKLGTLF
jgi:glycosyltransferase involved in cell wall biosynthesis